jgi:DNA-binding cell septation regulator SpoVG
VNIKVLEIRLLQSNKSTRAFADIRLDDIVVRDFRVYQTNGKPSIRNPFTTYKDVDGNLKFRQLVDLPSNVEAEVHSMILSEYFRRLKESGYEYRSQ